MRIGVSSIGYECVEHLDKVLAPWLELRKQGWPIFISVSHGVFPETAALGFPIYSTDGTIEEFHRRKALFHFDHVVIAEQPEFEKDLRNLTLPYLFEQNIDLLWLLDAQDEIYTIEQIKEIINFVESTPEYDWYKINFKNYVFNNNTYLDDFVVPRIWRTKRNEGITGFFYDNEILYLSGHLQNETPHVMVPRDIAFVRHLSWVGSPDYLIRKIKFQHNHYGACSYKWNYENNRLEFDAEYYKRSGKPLPQCFVEN